MNAPLRHSPFAIAGILGCTLASATAHAATHTHSRHTTSHRATHARTRPATPRTTHASPRPMATSPEAPLLAHDSVVDVSPASPELRALQFEGSGGGIALAGGDFAGRSIASGRLDVRVPASRSANSANWPVAGGMVALQGGGIVNIADGTLHMTRHGRNGWSLSGGTLAVIHPGNASETHASDSVIPADLDPLPADAPGASNPAAAGNMHAAGPVVLDAQTLAALDRLSSLAPRGSRDAIRQASAVEVTIHNAESAEPAVYNIPIVGRSVVLVVDTSYSMRDRDPDATDATIDPTSPPSKLDVARAELVRVLGALPPTTAVDIVAFSSEVQTLWPAPRVLDASARDEAIRWVAALRPGDETDPITAMQRANAMHTEQVVFVSDGRPTDHDSADQALLGLAGDIAARGARLDIVGIGTDQDAAFLDHVAERGMGRARHR